jgi:hypothetical protein
MSEASKKKPGKRKSELRARMRALLEDGSMASLRSEGRLVALYVLQVADWTSCQARFSVRHAAQAMRVRPNSVHRGLKQLIDSDILEVLSKTGRGFYRVKKRTHTVDSAPTARGHERPPLVDSAHTSGGRTVHDSCARRTPLVDTLSTGCGQDSVLSSGSSVRRTSEEPSTADALAGASPARRRRPEEGIDFAPPDAAAEAQEGLSVDASDTITQEVDA